jgi:transketolase
VIYLGFLAGLVPSAPGFSHQAVTDVGIMSSIPGMRVFEPSCATELRWAIDQALSYDGPSYIRVGGMTPAPMAHSVSTYLTTRVGGEDGAFVASGPLLAWVALDAAEILQKDHGIAVSVFTAPEICAEPGQVDLQELAEDGAVFVLENHNPALAKYSRIAMTLSHRPGVYRVGLDGVPANGQPAEVMQFHHLDAESLVALFLANRRG